MIIQGVGTDIVEIQRIEKLINKWGEKFLCRVFCGSEIKYAKSKQGFFYASIAARFAAKEAVMKSLGIGLSGASWLDIEITSESGRPEVLLRGGAKERAAAQYVKFVHLSLSHCREYALAFAVAEREVGNEAGNS